MISRFLTCVLLLASFAAASDAPKLEISRVPAGDHPDVHTLPIHVGGRALRHGPEEAPYFERQWPGTYFETAFVGDHVFFRLGHGEAILKITVDGHAAGSLTRPAPGLYALRGFSAGRHELRVEVITESQSEFTIFNGFYALADTKSAELKPRTHQIEFIGDSHTVGYGNTSPKHECTEAEVWSTTDTSQGIAPLVASRYQADYQVNAISGRGIVRNYNGFPGDTLPAAYPYTLFEHTARYADPNWHPQVIVISLGTNDFSTPLHPGERWKTRDELHADYEKTYVEFLHQIRAKNPNAYFILWATDTADGEVLSEVERVAAQARTAGEQRITVVPVRNLEFSACNFHPSLKDDRSIADAVIKAINGSLPDWKK